jgi:hypothetical protein
MNSRKKEIFLAAARNRKQALQIEFRPYTDWAILARILSYIRVYF